MRLVFINSEHSDPHKSVRQLYEFADIWRRAVWHFHYSAFLALCWNFQFYLTSLFIPQFIFQRISRDPLFCYLNSAVLTRRNQHQQKFFQEGQILPKISQTTNLQDRI
jgi:hypothetical protein